MAEETVILWAMQRLEGFLVETPSVKTSSEQIVKEVINELRMMPDFLRDKKSGERSMLNYLLADFAEIAQVSVDSFLTYIGNYRFDEKIAEALDWLRKTKKRMMNFGVGGGETTPQSVDQEEERDEGGVVVGLEEDVHQLIGRAILNKDSVLLTSCIKGMLGVGKTTLAQKIYNHPDVVEKFQRRAWVRISDDMSMKEVLVELIQQLVGGNEEFERDSLLEKMDIRSLQHMLRQRLQRVSFFIVVDNMLAEMRLESILEGLPREYHGSRLLVTSRYQIEKCRHYTHQMKPLDSDKSWELFLKTIYCRDKFTSDEDVLPKHLERKGREMLKKCGGLPIAIIDVARQKAKQRLSGIEWEELFDSIDLGESLKLLEPVYTRLDEQLKECFLHMSFFKENAIMREEKLEHIWAARGINTRRSESSSTRDFVGESIIDVAHDFQYPSEVKRCRINPLLHMLSIKKAEAEMGFQILRSNGNIRPSQNPRHRVIHCGRDKFNYSTNQDKHLVSLIFHGGGRYLDDASPSYWESFELLRILDLEDFGVKTLSEAIGTLFELRYLGLRNNYIQEIPHSFGGLILLEVLDIALNFMVEVSDVIGKMVGLRHVHMSDVICRNPLNIDALRNLMTLTYISIYDWTYEVSSLEKMTRLYKLGIEEVDENSDISMLFASVANLKSLSWLILRGFRFKSMPCLHELDILGKLCALKLDGCLSRLPINFPTTITYMVLVNTCLDEDPMLVLGYLPSLNALKLRNAYTGERMVIEHRKFNALQVLRINELWNLRNVQVGKKAMPWLKQLEIKNCPYLETLPKEIGSMKYLKKLKMVTTKHIAAKIRKSGLISKIVEVDIGPYII